ncbi:MAG: ABC transporter permease, partial [bacterium]
MIGHYLRFAIRHILRNRSYWIITIAGFAIGLSAALVISLYVYDDLIYDRSIPDSENIYRMYTRGYWDGEFRQQGATSTGALTARLTSVFPEVIAAVRMQEWEPRSVQRADLPLSRTRGVSVETVFADSSFLNVFNYQLIAGTKESALGTPRSVLLTRSTANILYDNEDPIGKPIIAAGLGEAVVGGVIEDPPKRSHMQFGMVLPIYANPDNVYWFENWNNLWVISYVRLRPGTDTKALEKDIREFVLQNTDEEWMYPTLMPVTDLHLYSGNQQFNWINSSPGDPQTLKVLAIIAAGILLIASINFINLTSARALKRAREVGLRKTLGATRSHLIRNYLGESLLMTVIAAVLALVLVQLLLPVLQQVIGKDLRGLLFASPLMIGSFLAITLIVGLLSGIYPAIVLTSFKPIEVMRGDFRASAPGMLLRRALVILQFTISIALIASVFIMRDQIRYALSMNMGYDREQVMLFETSGLCSEDLRESLLRQLNNDPLISAAGSSNNLPGPSKPWTGVDPTGDYDPEKSFGAHLYDIRGEWLDAIKVKVIQGRSFYTDSDIDFDRSVLLNETAARMTGEENLVGETLRVGPGLRTVVGIVADFNFGSARQVVMPIVFFPGKQYSSRVYVRLPAGRIPEGVDRVRDIFTEVLGQQLFGYRFLDDHFSKQYRSDELFASNATMFSVLAIFIAALGIFGMTTFTTEQRRREISVRKVLGANESGILWMLSWDMLKWVLLANVIAWPLA